MPVNSQPNTCNSVVNCDALIRENPNARRQMQRDSISVFVLNIQGLRAHVAELEFHLSRLQSQIVLLQETWLDASVESPSISDYITISRQDRAITANRGGVLTLARRDFNKLAHIENSVSDERSWHFLSLDPEIILVRNWYRPGATVHDGCLDPRFQSEGKFICKDVRRKSNIACGSC